MIVTRLRTSKLIPAVLSNSLNSTKQSFCIATETSATPPKIIPLMDMLKKRSEEDPVNLFDNRADLSFEYGIEPKQFRLQLYVYFKYAHWLSNKIATHRLQQFIEHYKREEKGADQTSEAKKKLAHQYRRQISIELIPLDILLYDLTQRLTTHLTLAESHLIAPNFQRLMFLSRDKQLFKNHRDNAYQLKSAFDRFLQMSLPWIEELPKSYKLKFIRLAKALRVFNLPFMEFLKQDLQKEKKDITLEAHLSALVYLGLGNSFPYEYFYRNKDSLIDFIEAAEANSDKKILACINYLQVFARVRLMYCEKIIYRLLICIEDSIPATELTQVARILKHYSHIQYGIKETFVMKLVERISLFSQQMDSMHYSMIVLAVARINYRNPDFVEGLKQYDYELFLIQLKYGCEKLGEYYQAILDEVQRSYKNTYGQWHNEEQTVEIPQQENSASAVIL